MASLHELCSFLRWGKSDLRPPLQIRKESGKAKARRGTPKHSLGSQKGGMAGLGAEAETNYFTRKEDNLIVY